MTTINVLHIYKQLVRASQTFPSKNRAKITKSIIEEFHINKTLKVDSEEWKKAIQIAHEGLATLKGFQFTGVNWTLETSKNPLNAPATPAIKKK